MQKNIFANRLREERDRLGMKQDDFGQAGGVKKLAQINYEKGDRSPDADYLAGIASIGADVQYILTGIRSHDPGMNPRHAALLDNFEHMSEEDRRCIERLTNSLSKQGVTLGKTGQ